MIQLADPADVTEDFDLGPLEMLVGYHLRRATATMRADYARTVEGAGVRQVLFGILSVISANPGINQGSVARLLGIRRPNMVALVGELVERGLVTRRVDDADRRAFVLNLTDAGAETVARTLARIRLHEERLLSGISPKQRIVLMTLLARISACGEPAV